MSCLCDSLLQTTKLYCGANVDDLADVLEHIHSVIPDSPLLAIGVSLGRQVGREKRKRGRECVPRISGSVKTTHGTDKVEGFYMKPHDDTSGFAVVYFNTYTHPFH